MSATSIYPFVAVFGFRKQGGGFTFILPGKEITIEGSDEVLPTLLMQCNGFSSVEKIAASVSVSTEYRIQEIKQLITILLEYQIIVDAQKYYEVFHEISVNPMPFFREVSSEHVAAMLHSESHLVQIPYSPRTKLEALFESRSSTREFSGESITEEDFLRLAWVMYGKLKRSTMYPESTIGLGTIPSGGALYPLRLYGIAMKIPTLQENGVYKFGPRGISYLRSTNAEELIQIFGEDPTSFTIEYTAAIFILACDFEQTTQKYSNRGYRYAFLEAGHAAQNAYLWCAEQGLGIVEVAGFNDKNLAKTLQLPYPKQAPLITLVIGRKKS